MRQQGNLSTWKDEQGYGFITPEGGGERVFLHINALTGRTRRPQENDLISYELTRDRQGRPQATAAAFVGQPKRQERRHGNPLPLLFTAGFAILLAATVFAGRLPGLVLWLYTGASLFAYIAYALDKSAARRNAWRTQESTLHLLALVGGWPGALAAQRLLRHKSAKTEFKLVFWATVVLNCTALGWLASAQGAKFLRPLLQAL